MDMEKCQNFTIEAYITAVSDFMVDIVEMEDVFEAYLYRNGYGVKSLMFGVDKAQTTKEDFISLVSANLHTHIDHYMEEVV